MKQKVRPSFFLVLLHFLIRFGGIFEALFIPAFTIFSRKCCFSRSASNSFNLISFKESFLVIMQIQEKMGCFSSNAWGGLI